MKMIVLLKKIYVKIRCAIDGEFLAKMLRKNGAKIGKNVHLGSGYIDPGFPFLIEIGDNVTFSKVAVLAHDGSTKYACKKSRVGKVIIGSNVFVGYGAIILPNVRIGNNVVIGAGSVVTHDIPDNSVAVGSPCRVVSTYEAFSEKNREFMKTHPVYDTYHAYKTQVEISRMQNELEGTWGYDE